MRRQSPYVEALERIVRAQLARLAANGETLYVKKPERLREIKARLQSQLPPPVA